MQMSVSEIDQSYKNLTSKFMNNIFYNFFTILLKNFEN